MPRATVGLETSANVKKTLAFCLYRYFPHGGLQRDMLRIALACQGRGYAIAVFTTAWEGDVPEGFELHIHSPGGLTNHSCMRRYHAWLVGELAEHQPTCIVGFNKLPGLDVYFAGDSCYAERSERRSPLFRRSARCRTYAAFEAAVFGPESHAEIMLIAESQRTAFQRHYQTPPARLHLLPPWIAPDRKRPEDHATVRQDIRASLGVDEQETLLLQVGSGFSTKGVDRTLRALAHLPAERRRRTKLAIVGRHAWWPSMWLPVKLGLTNNVQFLAGRDDVMALMAGADLLIHPGRNEAAGVVLIEALVSGLPVLCSGLCGHAHHIRAAQAGRVLSEPFNQAELDRHLATLLADDDLDAHRTHALAYAQTLDVYAMPEKAADLIETVAQRKSSHTWRP